MIVASFFLIHISLHLFPVTELSRTAGLNRYSALQSTPSPQPSTPPPQNPDSDSRRTLGRYRTTVVRFLSLKRLFFFYILIDLSLFFFLLPPSVVAARRENAATASGPPLRRRRQRRRGPDRSPGGAAPRSCWRIKPPRSRRGTGSERGRSPGGRASPRTNRSRSADEPGNLVRHWTTCK